MSWEPSPPQRKLLFACTVVVLTAVGIYLTAPELFGAGDPGRRTPAPNAPGAVAEPPRDGRPSGATRSAATPSPSAAESTVLPAYTKTALSFMRAFTDTGRSADAWHDGVARHSTADLADGLAHTDPESVPEGAPTGRTRVLSTGETGAEIAVPLDSGTRIVVTVTSVGRGYAVSDVRPQGDR